MVSKKRDDVYYSRAIISGRQKFLLTLVILGFVVYAFLNPRIIEAFLTFWFGGVVPGTDIVLPPEVVILGTGICAVLCIAFFIIRIYLGATRRRVHIPVREIVTVPIAIKEFSDEAPVAKPALQHPLRKRTTHALSMRVWSLCRTMGAIVIFSATIAGRVLSGIGRVIVTGAAVAALGAGTLAKTYAKAILATGKILNTMLRAVWRGSKPLLRTLDEWLGILVQKLEVWVKKKITEYESLHLMQTIGKEFKQTVKASAPKVLSAASKKETAPADK